MYSVSIRARVVPWLWLAASLWIAFGVWHWAENILVPANTAQAIAKSVPIGNNSDLYPLWLGTRELLLRHRDPYSTEVTREIQIGFYGRPLAPRCLSDPTDRQAFVYPVYVSLLLAPTIEMSFSSAQKLFQWLLLLSVAFSVPLWMQAIQLRAGWVLTLSGMVLAASSFAAVHEYVQQNLTALVLLLVAAGAAMVVRDCLVLSGCLLAVSTFKPQLSGPLILWFLLWAFAGWKERKRLVWSFLAAMSALLAVAQWLSPHWIARFLIAVREYQRYGMDSSLARTLLPSLLGDLVNVALVVALTFVCWYSRRASAGSPHFSWALGWVAIVTLAIVPKLAPAYHLLLTPVLLVMLAQPQTNRGTGGLARTLTKGTFACQLWQWLTASGLSLLTLIVPAERLRPAADLPLYTLYALPVLALLTVIVATISLRERFFPRVVT
jgi:hypothetical protein